MYSVAILGTGISAHLMARLCNRSGFDDVSLTTSDGQEPDQLLAENGPHNDLDTLAASQTRVLFALGLGEALMDHACLPDREQVRLAASGYLLSELPLGKFYQDRYGAPMLNIHPATRSRTSSGLLAFPSIHRSTCNQCMRPSKSWAFV